MFETIAHVADPALARVLIAALQAHGFHPMEGGQNGLPGLPGVVTPRGIPIRVPDEEARDGKLLADDLLKDMQKR
ncbi:MAG TPA: hypothetical protein VHZ56_10835 [Devosia sp.]|nr:hypothetical protein [Devosia sp.]